MKTIFDIFDENFSLIYQTLNEFNLRGCKTISTDLIKMSEMMDYFDGLFIGEVLESVFSQIEDEIAMFNIPEPEKEEVKLLLMENLKVISECYKNDDKNNLFNALKEFRTTATKFQFSSRRKNKLIAQKLPGPFEIIRR